MFAAQDKVVEIIYWVGTYGLFAVTSSSITPLVKTAGFDTYLSLSVSNGNVVATKLKSTNIVGYYRFKK